MNNTSIFYSWQSDHKGTKYFIDNALNVAIAEIAGNNTLDKAPRLDKDTQGIIGSPSIVSTIKQKIDSCGVFIADVSLIDESSNGRKLVNQNVMFELGYAIAKHTELNTILLFNSDLGRPSDLPFDISHHRLLQFSIKEDDRVGKKLKGKLVRALTAHLINLDDHAVEQVKKSLDEVQLLIMRVFAGIKDDKRILIINTLGGPILQPMGTVSDQLSNQLSQIGPEEVVANLNDLVESGILALSYGSRGTPNYKPAKRGFEIIKVLNNKSV